MRNPSSSQRKNSSLGPVVLILLGVVFLLNNFGILSWNIWLNLWKFWPLLLILIGFEVIIGRSSSIKGFLVLVALIFIVPLALIFNPLGINPFLGGSLTLDEPLLATTNLKLDIELPASNVTVDSLDASSKKLLQGTVRYPQILPKPQVSYNSYFNQASLSLTQDQKASLPFLSGFSGEAKLSLTRLIPLNLTIKTSAGKNSLDFANLRVDVSEIDTGASQTTINFSSKYSAKTFIRADAGLITLRIPKEVGASIKIDSNLKTIKIDERRFVKKDNLYQTSNFASTTTKLEIEISATAASIEVD